MCLGVAICYNKWCCLNIYIYDTPFHPLAYLHFPDILNGHKWGVYLKIRDQTYKTNLSRVQPVQSHGGYYGLLHISTHYKYTTAVTRGGLCAGDVGRTPQCPHPPGVARSHEVGEDPYGARRGERAARLFHAKFVSLEILLLPGWKKGGTVSDHERGR